MTEICKYGRTQALTAFINTPKLIIRVLSKEPMYAYDNKNMLIASDGTAGYCAISNLAHPYTEKLFQIQGSDFKHGFTATGILENEKNRLIERIENLITKVYQQDFQVEI